jgi:hypothetical protein
VIAGPTKRPRRPVNTAAQTMAIADKKSTVINP